MKLVLIGISALVGLVLLVAVIGGLLPKEHTISRSAVFKGTPEQLYALIDGPQTWRSEVKRYEPLAATDGRRQWRELNDHGETITYEALKRDPPLLLETQIITDDLPYSGTWTLRLQPRNSSTVLRITEQGEVYNPVSRFLSRFVIGPSHTIETYLRDLGTATGQTVQIQN
jgi:hypothetical protein